ncbi:MAG: hypothetical protein H6573_10720 [Lewinellaceae bacterium]|nr:hypothetical protein [Phaeodactylibacter sp.]MCB0615153.1 hypothetical protein [Phaeodactylibacter sp.]MCB9347967.1 hypothetical protein [Lewinellaceae bacterium]
MNMRILSYEYLQWQIRQLSSLVEELDPHNFHRLLKAMNEVEELTEDLLEVLAFSGNKHTASYEAAFEAGEKRTALAALLEYPSDYEELELGVIHLQKAICKLARVLQAKLAVAFPFSLN